MQRRDARAAVFIGKDRQVLHAGAIRFLDVQRNLVARRRPRAGQGAAETLEAGRQLVDRRRDEHGIAWPCPADPVLRGSKFTRLLGCTAPFGEQFGMHFTDQP